MRKIIVNGANGYVASHFINDLLEQGHQVVALARESDQSSARERVERALDGNGGTGVSNRENLTVYGYSLLDEDFAIPDKDLKTIFEDAFAFFHFAASLKYDFKSKEEILDTNVGGVENSLKVYEKYAPKNARFIFIGTAYSCGNFNGLFQEEFYPDQDVSAFRNYYEYSKRLAENILKEHREEFGTNAHVIRLSQVVGNSHTGVANTDYGIFDFSKRLCGISRRHPNETVRIKVDPDSTQNLIPINTVVNYLSQAVNADEIPTIMNFVASSSIKNMDVIEILNGMLSIDIVPDPHLDPDDMSTLERLIAVGMSFTGRYTSIDLKFDTSKRDAVIEREVNEIDRDIVAKMLEYFVTHVCEQPAVQSVTVEG